MTSPSNDVDHYLEQFTGDTRTRLDTLRSVVRELVPDASESLAYGLVAYKYKKKPLVYFGGFKNHIGFYATPNGHETFAVEFSKYKQGKGSVQFPLDKPLPTELIVRVVDYRTHAIDTMTQ